MPFLFYCFVYTVTEGRLLRTRMYDERRKHFHYLWETVLFLSVSLHCNAVWGKLWFLTSRETPENTARLCSPLHKHSQHISTLQSAVSTVTRIIWVRFSSMAPGIAVLMCCSVFHVGPLISYRFIVTCGWILSSFKRPSSIFLVSSAGQQFYLVKSFNVSLLSRQQLVITHFCPLSQPGSSLQELLSVSPGCPQLRRTIQNHRKKMLPSIKADSSFNVFNCKQPWNRKRKRNLSSSMIHTPSPSIKHPSLPNLQCLTEP